MVLYVCVASMLNAKVTASFVDECLLSLLSSVDEMDIKCFFFFMNSKKITCSKCLYIQTYETN